MSGVLCIRCARADEELEQLHATLLKLRAENATLTGQVKELVKVNALQAADLVAIQNDPDKLSLRRSRVRREPI